MSKKLSKNRIAANGSSSQTAEEPHIVASTAPEADEDIETESHEATDIFAAYEFHNMVPGCRPHPGHVVESGCLASIALPRLTYQLDGALPQELITSGKLSSLQLEGILYGAQAHQMLFPDGRRRGFFIGDAAGIGKGRQIAGIIMLNCVRGCRKHIWFSISPDLIVDAQRDLHDIGCYIKVIEGCKRLDHEMRAFGLSKEYQEGVLFSTYSTLVSSVKKTTVKGTSETRLQQLLNWCGGEDFDGCLIFDECHKAKNFVSKREEASSRVALAVVEIQRRLPRARVLYCSATGVSGIKNMAYMDRLGLWGDGCAFKSFDHFLDMVQKKGLGVAEMLAMEMKASGGYVSRSLSYNDTEFELVDCKLLPETTSMYDRACHLWRELRLAYNVAVERCKVTGGRGAGTLYWGAHQRFFHQLCQALKVHSVVVLAKEALANGQCVVIGLQATGEASLVSSAAHKELEEDSPGAAKGLVSNCREILINFIRNHFPTEIRGEADRAKSHDDWSVAARDLLLQFSKSLKLPPTALDDLIHQLGGPSQVAEMTGRRVRLVWDEASKKFCMEARDSSTSTIAGPVTTQSSISTAYLASVESVNIQERAAFMSGDKLVAVISDAASTGISLHADCAAANQRRRVHITLELPWSAEKAVQQLGRSHRSNQACAPIYRLVTTELPGEHRFTAAVAKRLEYLGALSRGDRRAVVATGGFSQSHVDTMLGGKALKSLAQRLTFGLNRKETPTGQLQQQKVEDLLKAEFERNLALADGDVSVFVNRVDETTEMGHVKEETKKMSETVNDGLKDWHSVLRDLFEDMGLLVRRPSVSAFELVVQEASLKVSTFLNRLLGLHVKQQLLVFGAFMVYLEFLKDEARLQGVGGLLTTEEGLVDLRGALRVTQLEPSRPVFPHRPQYASLPTERVLLQVDRGMPWNMALGLLKDSEHLTASNGFYKSRTEMFGHRMVLLALHKSSNSFRIIRPNVGISGTEMTEPELQSKYSQLTDLESARRMWCEAFQRSLRECLHGPYCRLSVSGGVQCQFGRRCYTLCLLTGSVLAHMNALENILQRHAEAWHLPRHERFLRVMRVNIHGYAYNPQQEPANVEVVPKTKEPVIVICDSEEEEQVEDSQDTQLEVKTEGEAADCEKENMACDKLTSQSEQISSKNETNVEDVEESASSTLKSVKRIIGLRYPLCLLPLAEEYARVQHEQDLLQAHAKDAASTGMSQTAKSVASGAVSWRVEPQVPVQPSLLKKATTSPKKITHFFKPQTPSRQQEKEKMDAESPTRIVILDVNSSNNGTKNSLKRSSSRLDSGSQSPQATPKRQASVVSMFQRISAQPKMCPICKVQFPVGTSNGEINDHIDDCLIE